ncbi:MAG: DUF58 domain-containing protein [Desulfovibrionaceae bacterium]
MLSPELVKTIRRLHIRTSRTVDAMMAGRFRSVFRGSGLEFEEVRGYVPGDDVKAIDWKVTARMRRPFVKVHREERELTVMLLVDVSASLRFGTGAQAKRDKALEAAAVLAFNAVKNNDKVGLVLFTDRVERYIPPGKGSAHVFWLIKEVMSWAPASTRTDVGAAVDFLGKVQRRRTVSFLLSDLQSPDFLRPLRIAARRHDMVAVRAFDPGEGRLPESGLVEAEDLETGERMLLDASHAPTRRAWLDLREGERARALAALRQARVDLVEIPTDGSVAEALIRFFRIREKRFR